MKNNPHAARVAVEHNQTKNGKYEARVFNALHGSV
jgi:hypothetical protein